jgi:hypothetical protein
VQALELFAFDARLKREVEVGERLDRRQARRAHRRLQASAVAQRDLCVEEGHDGGGPGELAAIDLLQDGIDRFERAGHFEIGELRAQPVAQRQPRGGRGGAHQATSSSAAAAAVA